MGNKQSFRLIRADEAYSITKNNKFIMTKHPEKIKGGIENNEGFILLQLFHLEIRWAVLHGLSKCVVNISRFPKKVFTGVKQELFRMGYMIYGEGDDITIIWNHYSGKRI